MMSDFLLRHAIQQHDCLQDIRFSAPIWAN